MLSTHFRYKKDVFGIEAEWSANNNRMKMRFARLKNDVLPDEAECEKCKAPATAKCVTCNVGVLLCEECLCFNHVVFDH